jgi:F-type H+-transporting ATPase subunit a
MIDSPLTAAPAFALGPVVVTKAVVTTWALMAVLAAAAWLATRRLRRDPGSVQAALELMVSAIDGQIRAPVGGEPAPYRALVGGLFVFVLAANWSSLAPGVEPPTATLETDAALAAIVLGTTIWHGMRARGALGYVRSFAEPSWVMIPLNMVEQLTRTFSLMVRLFGNVMSGVFVIGIVLSLAGLLVPIPLMALDLLTGAVQAYIFATLAMVFIASAVGGEQAEKEA